MSLNLPPAGSAAAYENRRKRVLKSLEYDLMDARRDYVEEPDENNYHWIFAPDENDPDKGEHGSDENKASSDEGNGLEDHCHRGVEPWDSFSDWLTSGSSIYWISGKPGSGKSSLMKFLLGNSKTRSALEVWAAEPAIISHFFWKPGSTMQNSIKGMLCSLLHQALSTSSEVLASTLTNFSGVIGAKKTHADWSVEELRFICINVMGRYPQALCIFIDGLDELGEAVEWLELLEIIDELSSSGNLKVCVASRPEPILKSHFEGKPHLKLQDLTAKDMFNYAKTRLRPFLRVHQVNAEVQKRVFRQLVYKAEGVFLWLHLVVQQFVRGLRDFVPGEDLYEQVDRLPHDLLALYRDMWERLNENTPTNQAIAAKYFNLAISNKRLMSSTWGYFCDGSSFDTLNQEISVLHMVAATDDAIQSALLGDQTSLSECLQRKIHESCQNMQKDIEVRCGGLLEVSSGWTDEPSFSGTRAEETSAPASLADVLNFWHQKIQFIHRSAYDFLADTPDGLEIRDSDPTSEDERWLNITKGFLAVAQPCHFGVKGHVYRALAPLSMLAASSLRPEIDRVLAICHTWYSRGALGLFDDHAPQSPDDGPKPLSPPFLALAAYPIFRDFIISTIEHNPDPSREATKVLRHLSDRPFRLGSVIDNLYCYLRQLLRLGAKPSEKGVIRRDRYSRQLCKEAVNFDSAFGRFLIVAARQYNPHTMSRLRKLDDVLRTFMSTYPNLDDRTSIGVKFSAKRNANRHGSWINDPDEFELTSTYHAMLDAITHDVCFILSVNLACLLNIVHKRATDFYGQNTSASTSIVSGFPNNQVLPHAQVKYVMVKENSTRKYYRLTDEHTSEDMARIMEQCLGGNGSDLVLNNIDEMIANIRSDIASSRRYEEVDSIFSCLAEEERGYIRVSDSEYEDLVNIVE